MLPASDRARAGARLAPLGGVAAVRDRLLVGALERDGARLGDGVRDEAP